MTGKIELSDDQWAVIRPKKTVSERDSRRINRAYVPMLLATNKLLKGLPFDPEDAKTIGVPSIKDGLIESVDGEVVYVLTTEQLLANAERQMENYVALSEEEIEATQAYDPLVTSIMVHEWSYELAITPENVLTIPADDWATMNAAAMKEWDQAPDASVDATDDPKAGAAN
jgi:hypothetical protein